MGIFKDAISNIRKVVMADDEGFLNDGNEYIEESDDKPSFFSKFGNKPQNKSFIPFKKNERNMDLANLDYDQAKQNASARRDNRGAIQVYVPRTFEEAFDIIKNIENGFTAMVNVETANQVTATRIVDVISGAMYALKGQCKKIGEKQYIFTLNAELSGAIDFLPGQSNPYNNKNYQGFDMQNPFSFGNNTNTNPNPYDNMPNYQPNPNPPQPQFNPYNMQNQNYDYIKPQNQF